MKIEFDYCILKKGKEEDYCYAFVDIDGEEILEIMDELLENNSDGSLADIPEKYFKRFVNAALEDAITIYPDFDDEKEEYSVMLQKWIPEDLLNLLPDELRESFSPEMFE